jgi:DNA polymerase IV
VSADPPSAGSARTILHVDMDAFYVGVEVRRRPELRGRAVIVGGTGNRGVVAACSYEARRFGVHSAMPSSQARRRCPHALFLPPDFAAYEEASRQVHEIFRGFTPLVEPIALDEAFLDVTGARRLFGGGPEIATELRRRITDEVRLGCSVGVAPTKLLAKLASEAAKPKASPSGVRPGRMIVVVPPGGEVAFLHPLPVQALWGVGPATLERLRRLGVATVGDLAALPLDALVAGLGQSSGRHLHGLASGVDDRPVEPDREAKSVGHEQTFAHDLHDRDELDRELVRLADAVATRLRRAGVAGRTVTVKIRFGSFATITRSETTDEVVDTGVALLAMGRRLLAAVDPTPGVRLLGLSVSNLAVDAPRQLRLDGTGDETVGTEPEWIDATRAVDEIRDRFGDAAIGPASLVRGEPGRRRLAPLRRGEQQWGPDAPDQATGGDDLRRPPPT